MLCTEKPEADHPIGLIGLSLGPRASGGPRACSSPPHKKEKKEREKEKRKREKEKREKREKQRQNKNKEKNIEKKRRIKKG